LKAQKHDLCTNHAEGLVDPKVLAKIIVSDFGYPKACRIVDSKISKSETIFFRVLLGRAFRTRPFHRTRTQTEVRNSDSDSGSDFRNCDFPTP
jgi:hypothetical protein